jgi:hypothetical protein
MCWNQSVSLNTFLFGLFAVSLALYNKVLNPLGGIGAMALISMQLIEFFAWRNLGNKDTMALLSKVGLGLIGVQPLLVHLELFKTYLVPVIYLGYVALYLGATLSTTEFTMVKAPNGHLRWNWLTKSPLLISIWLAFLILPFLYVKNYVLFLGLLIPVLISLYTYYKDNTWGSMWCWISNVYSAYLVAQVFGKDICL